MNSQPDVVSHANAKHGPSIWPIELSRELPPTASIDAVDLSLAQCPPKAWLPKNITLIAHDVFLPFPDSMVGQYDVVHIQLFACVVKKDDPAPLVKNVMSLLSKCIKVTALLTARFLAKEGRRVRRGGEAHLMSLHDNYANVRDGRTWWLSTMERC